MKAIIYFILMLIPCAAVAQVDAVGNKEVGDSAYAKGDYQAAIEAYQAILADNSISPEIYYNLGNAYYKTSEIGKAILNYERALLLDPSDEDIRFNLELARSKAVDKVVPMSEMFFVTWIKSLVNIMSEKGWAKMGIATFILMLLSLALYFFGKKIVWKKIGFISAICLLLFLILLELGMHHLVQNRSAYPLRNFSLMETICKNQDVWNESHIFLLHLKSCISVPHLLPCGYLV